MDVWHAGGVGEGDRDMVDKRARRTWRARRTGGTMRTRGQGGEGGRGG